MDGQSVGGKRFYHDAAVKDDSLAVSCSQVGNIYLKNYQIQNFLLNWISNGFPFPESFFPYIETPFFQYFK